MKNNIRDKNIDEIISDSQLSSINQSDLYDSRGGWLAEAIAFCVGVIVASGEISRKIGGFSYVDNYGIAHKGY